ncbi:uncharacterized protein LOC115880365 [Sitophilus oryzae]|uniref:Uncharacterized protein LOC115880365 n=1 Tax=Sitophilus oryzae TaxID=7048 RepID=A0A6J2XRG2_SITOR|nr:uncharacterized protein LOC115880365 [Sitophilus oryzae]
MYKHELSKVPANLDSTEPKTLNKTHVESMFIEFPEILSTDNESDFSSGITDVFEEYHKESFLRPLPGTKTKYLSKLEADKKTLDEFTDDFKRTMRKLRDELELNDDITVENEDDIEKTLNGDEKNVFFKESRKIEVEEPIPVDTEVCQSETTSNSAIWNMIKAHRGPYFYASPPHYDIFCTEPEDHYLRRPEIPWKKVDESRKKCEQWLEQRCQ